MNDVESGQSAQLNWDHRDMDPGHGAGLGGFVITDPSPLMHQPAERALDDPAARQDFETFARVRTFDDFHCQFGTKSFDPLGEDLTGIADIHPQHAQPSKPSQDLAQKHLCSVTFGGVSGSYGHAQHQAQSIHQQMTFAAFDHFAGVIANAAVMPGGFDTLTVQFGSEWVSKFVGIRTSKTGLIPMGAIKPRFTPVEPMCLRLFVILQKTESGYNKRQEFQIALSLPFYGVPII